VGEIIQTSIPTRLKTPLRRSFRP